MMITEQQKGERKMEDRLYLSQTLLKEWEYGCQIKWKARFVEKLPEMNPEPEEGSAMRLGVIFEVAAVGAGMGGKIIKPTDKEKKSVGVIRALSQAKLYREYMKTNPTFKGGKYIGVQKLIEVSFEHNGVTIYISGNLDVVWQYASARRAVIDLKSTADLDSTFGAFCWGSPTEVDMTQIVHYKLLHQLFYGEDCDTWYLVFDLTAKEKFQPIQVEVSEQTIEEHKDRLARVYGEIKTAMEIDWYEPNNKYSICKECAFSDRCEYFNPYPDVKTIVL